MRSPNKPPLGDSARCFSSRLKDEDEAEACFDVFILRALPLADFRTDGGGDAATNAAGVLAASVEGEIGEGAVTSLMIARTAARSLGSDSPCLIPAERRRRR